MALGEQSVQSACARVAWWQWWLLCVHGALAAWGEWVVQLSCMYGGVMVITVHVWGVQWWSQCM